MEDARMVLGRRQAGLTDVSISTTGDGATRDLGRGLTFGVEEEFLLLDPGTGEVAATAPAILASLAGEPGVKAEAMRYPLETNTAVHTSLADLYDDMARRCDSASQAAAGMGLLVAACGVVPGRLPGVSAVTARGEVAPAALKPRLATVAVDLLRNEYALNGVTTVPDGVLVEIVDEVFLPLVRAHA